MELQKKGYEFYEALDTFIDTVDFGFGLLNIGYTKLYEYVKRCVSTFNGLHIVYYSKMNDIPDPDENDPKVEFTYRCKYLEIILENLSKALEKDINDFDTILERKRDIIQEEFGYIKTCDLLETIKNRKLVLETIYVRNKGKYYDVKSLQQKLSESRKICQDVYKEFMNVSVIHDLTNHKDSLPLVEKFQKTFNNLWVLCDANNKALNDKFTEFINLTTIKLEK